MRKLKYDHKVWHHPLYHPTGSIFGITYIQYHDSTLFLISKFGASIYIYIFLHSYVINFDHEDKVRRM